jgi:hypothetical protein
MSDFQEPSGPSFGDMLARGAGGAAAAVVVPPAAPVVPANPAEAMARMETLKGDVAWRDKFLAGNGPELKEFHSLNKLIASGDDIDRAMAGVPEQGVFQRSEYVEMTGTAAMLRDHGFGPTAIREALTGQGFTQADVDRATQWKAGAMRNRDFVSRYLGGDFEAAKEMAAANIVLTNGVKKEGA